MYLIYSVLLTLGVVALLPRFALDALRHGKYAAGFRERMGRLPPFSVPEGGHVIWLHCVSVGETQAARPLVRALLAEFPTHNLVVSTTTQTGQRVAREVFGSSAALVFYFPFDWAWSVRRALRAIRPSVVVVMETELWPRFFRECRARRVPVALVNGRISEKSFRRYRRIEGFIRRVVGDLSLAIMQSAEDAERIRALGLAPDRIRISGNIKFDADAVPGEQALTDQLRARFSCQDGRPLVVAASTHAPEERLLLEAFRRLRDAHTGDSPRLLIAPRHPERFSEVASHIAAAGLVWARRSAPPRVGDAGAEVILLDSIGELRAVYPLAEIVFVGGSIAPVGGHNVLEPAAAARCIITGAHTSNFTAVVRALLDRGALLQLPEISDAAAPDVLAHALREFLDDDEKRRTMGERALTALDENRGAAARTVAMLAPLLQRQRSEARGQRLVETEHLTSDL
jgi:3-deoxy-D-manno-octulosonic-acid transferase